MAIDWNKIKSNAQVKDTAQYSAMKADKEKVVSSGGSFSTYSPDYEKRQSELAEQRRQAQVDLDIDTINRIDAELKTLRANAGKQTAADRVGDVVGASASGTVGNVANAAGTLLDLLNGSAQSKTVNNLYNFSDTAAKDTERFTKDAKQGLGKVGQFAVDAGVAGGQLLTDMAASALVPGAGLALMGARGFGGGAQEARQQGATLGQQAAYGAGTAAVSVLSEKLFNVAGPYAKTFGKGFFDKVAFKLTGSAAGRVIASALTEGAEEGLESVLQPVLKNLTYTDGEKVDWSEVAYEALIGAALGGLGGGADIAATQGTRNSAKQGSATVPVVSEGSNAPKTNVAQNGLKSDSSVIQSTQKMPVSDGLGAANLGFDPYSNLQNQTDKFHPEGPNAARPTDMPTTNAEGRNIPKSASTIYGAEGTTESGVKILEQKIVSGEIAFDTITDADSVANAKNTIAEKTFEGALEQYRQAVNSGVASKDNTTLGQQLLLQAMRDGDETATAELLTLYTRNSTTTAQALQAQSIFRKLSPEGQLVAVQKAIDAMNKKYGVEHTIDPVDVKAFLEAKDEVARKEAEKNIVQKAAKSVPGTFKAKFDTIRYLAMLGNPRTHIRNILGNTLFQIPVSVKNRVGALAEVGHNTFSKNKLERTKSLLGANPFGALAKDAKADWANVKDFLSQNTKYNENRSTLKDIENAAHAFSDDTLFGKAVNTLSDANSDLLAVEDMMAKRMIYTQSLAGYLKANGCKRIADASPDLLNRARTYAANEALRNTFNDSNVFSDAVAKIGNLKDSNNAVVRGAGYVAEGVLPFKRTPANILVRAEEYSPIGAGVGIINTIRGAKNGDTATISKGLDQLASGLTGIALMKLGAMAVANGWVTGGEDEDEKQEDFDDLTGHQNYALELKDGTSVTLDWLAPEAIPFFVGVELYNAGLNGETTVPEFMEAMGNATAPMLEMSMLQSLNDTVNNASYAAFSGGSVLKSLVTSALTNYLTQAVPTLGGQIERSGEEQRMTTYTDKNSDLSTEMQYTIGKVSQKIPGWDYQQIPYIDAWGRTESNGDPLERAANNLFNPAYMSEVDVDKVEQELQRVYNADKGESGNVFPQGADKSFTVNKETKNLTADEYVKYAKAKGQNSYKLAKEAINSAAYKSMNDSGKAAFIDDMYGYADYKAKRAVAPKYSNEKYAKYEAAEKAGMSPSAYYAMKETYDYDHSSSTGQPTQEEAQRYLDTETNLSNAQKADLWTIINKSWKNNPYD